MGPEWKGETKACNFNLPDIVAIIILGHLLKTKWSLSCERAECDQCPIGKVDRFPGTVARNMSDQLSHLSRVRTLG